MCNACAMCQIYLFFIFERGRKDALAYRLLAAAINSSTKSEKCPLICINPFLAPLPSGCRTCYLRNVEMVLENSETLSFAFGMLFKLHKKE